MQCWNSDVLRSLIVLYLRGPQGQYIYERTSTAECHQLIPESTDISGHTRHHCLRPYKISRSPAIQDISVSSHKRHLRLRLYKTSPPLAVHDISISSWDLHMQYSPLLLYTVEQETKWIEWNKVILITASLTPCESEQGKSTAIAWGWPSIKKQRNPHAKKKSETTLNWPLLP